MSASTTNNSSPRTPSWRAPAVLAFIHAVFTIFVIPWSLTTNWWFMLLSGPLYVQPILFGSWAALGGGSNIVRITFSLLVYAAINILACGVLSLAGHNGAGEMQIYAILFATCVSSMILMLLVRKATNWRVDYAPGESSDGIDSGQFSLKFLIGLTTACAVLLGIGRGLATSQAFADSEFRDVLRITGFLLMLMFPAIIAPLAVISQRLSKRVWIAILLSWIILSVLGIGAYTQIERNTFDWEEVIAIFSIQFGAFIAAATSALVLRLAGFRLVRRASKTSSSSVPSP